MTDHSDLIERLERESDPQTIAKLICEALSSQSLSLSEARERCAGWAVSFAKKCEEHQEALREIERLKGLVAGIRETPQEPSEVEALKAEIKRLRTALVEAREEIIGMTRMRGFEGEGTDADYVSFIDVALSPVEKDQGR